MGDLSPHFDTREFRCRGFGRADHPAHPTIVLPQLVARLELLRAELGRPIVIVSGHRCSWWNRRIGGAPKSQHIVGAAADLKPGLLRVPVAEKLGFRGIGHHAGWVVHVDVRKGPVVIFRDP